MICINSEKIARKLWFNNKMQKSRIIKNLLLIVIRHIVYHLSSNFCQSLFSLPKLVPQFAEVCPLSGVSTPITVIYAKVSSLAISPPILFQFGAQFIPLLKLVPLLLLFMPKFVPITEISNLLMVIFCLSLSLPPN